MPTEPRSLHVRTPLWRSLPISRAAGCPVSLKMEALQPDGSFKIRGIGRLCAQAVANGTRHLVSASGGNAGISTASAARELGVRATIFVFDGVPPTALDRIRDQGAEVVQAGATWADANRAAIRAAEAPGAFYVHPFDHAEIWTGHSTLVDEIVADGLRPSHMVLAVGGGGLLAGVLEGLDRHGLQDTQIIAVETEGTASLHAALQAGQLVRLAKISSVAKTLGADQVAAGAFERALTHRVESLVVTDDQALSAVHRFALDHRVLVEPAAGAALAVAYGSLGSIGQAQHAVIVVCGGAGIALAEHPFAYR
ncbi:MAG: pyridoxal-phosphate dependent enzyme [Myxococcota bacterium]